MIEAKYVLGKQGSKKYGWLPKISFSFLIWLLITPKRYTSVLHEQQHQQHEYESDQLKQLSMDDAIEERIILYYFRLVII